MFQRLAPQEKRSVRLEMLKKFYLEYLVEDPIDGTSLDCEVLDIIDALKKKYKDDQGQLGVSVKT